MYPLSISVWIKTRTCVYVNAWLIVNTLRLFVLWSVSGSFAGGQRITVSGTGLYEDVNVTVCDLACSVRNSQDTTSLVCDTPAHSGTYHDCLFTYHTDSININ